VDRNLAEAEINNDYQAYSYQSSKLNDPSSQGVYADTIKRHLAYNYNSPTGATILSSTNPPLTMSNSRPPSSKKPITSSKRTNRSSLKKSKKLSPNQSNSDSDPPEASPRLQSTPTPSTSGAPRGSPRLHPPSSPELLVAAGGW
jgi:hypothetical protein